MASSRMQDQITAAIGSSGLRGSSNVSPDYTALLGGTSSKSTGSPGVIDPLQTDYMQALMGGALRGPTTSPTRHVSLAKFGNQEILGQDVSSQSNPIGTQQKTAAALSDYNAKSQAAQVSRGQAEQGLAGMQQANDLAVGNTLANAAASRQRIGDWTEVLTQGGKASGDKVRAAADETIVQATQREQAIADDTLKRWGEVVNKFTNTSALAGQQLAIGARQNYLSAQKNLESAIASGAPGMTPGAITAAKAQLKGQYQQGLGMAVAQVAQDFNKSMAELGSTMTQHLASVKQALGTQSVGAYNQKTNAEMGIAQLDAANAQLAIRERAAHELAMVQLETQAEYFRTKGATAEAEFLTSPAMQPYVGELSPLLDSISSLMQADVDAYNRTHGVQATVGGVASAGSPTRRTAGGEQKSGFSQPGNANTSKQPKQEGGIWQTGSSNTIRSLT